jgi:hypothetical protein
MKVFWWGDIDDLSGTLPPLHWMTENGTAMIEWSNKNERLRQLLEAGYTEISRRSAYTAGLPI